MPATTRAKTISKTFFFLCLIIITILSLIPQDEGRGLALPRLTSSGADLHALAYAVTMLLGLVFCLRSTVALTFFLLMYGTLLEAVQIVVPTRSFNPLDILANAAGVFFALVLDRFYGKWSDKRVKQHFTSV